jgi:hypothetical protein
LGLIETKRTNCLLHFIFVIYVTTRREREREGKRVMKRGVDEEGWERGGLCEKI